MYYLSELVGGATAFPILGLAATPKPGTAVFWWSWFWWPLLSPSGDLGIGLVWDYHPPDRTPPPPRSFLVRLLKSSSNWTKVSMTGPQLFSGWYQMILDVFQCSQPFFRCFQLGWNFYGWPPHVRTFCGAPSMKCGISGRITVLLLEIELDQIWPSRDYWRPLGNSKWQLFYLIFK